MSVSASSVFEAGRERPRWLGRGRAFHHRFRTIHPAILLGFICWLPNFCFAQLPPQDIIEKAGGKISKVGEASGAVGMRVDLTHVPLDDTIFRTVARLPQVRV